MLPSVAMRKEHLHHIYRTIANDETTKDMFLNKNKNVKKGLKMAKIVENVKKVIFYHLLYNQTFYHHIAFAYRIAYN